MIIYKATNKVNGKVYIGQTKKTFKVRIGQHKTESRIDRNNMVICKAIRKYGFENFEWEVIDKAETQEELDKKECYYISLYDSYNNGYNATLGGGGIIGFKLTKEQREKKKKNAKRGKEHWSYGTVGANKGVKFSDEWKENLRKGAVGRKVSKPFTEEHLKKKSLAQQGEKGTSARLTESDVLKIRELYATGEYYQKQLAEMFGVVRGSVSDIVTRKTWKHI